VAFVNPYQILFFKVYYLLRNNDHISQDLLINIFKKPGVQGTNFALPAPFSPNEYNGGFYKTLSDFGSYYPGPGILLSLFI